MLILGLRCNIAFNFQVIPCSSALTAVQQVLMKSLCVGAIRLNFTVKCCHEFV